MSSPKLPTMRQHFKDVHVRFAEHAVAKSKGDRSESTHFATLAGCCDADSDAAKAYAGISKERGTSADHWADLAQFLTDCAKEFGDADKAAGTDDLAKFTLDGISGIVPDVPQSVRAVPRFGQKEFGERAPVAPELEKVLSMDDE